MKYLLLISPCVFFAVSCVTIDGQVTLCGDGVVQSDEECDAGAGNDAQGACTPECVLNTRLAFVTSTTHLLPSSVAAANQICNSRASEQGFPGEYMAWLSFEGEGGNAIDRLRQGPLADDVLIVTPSYDGHIAHHLDALIGVGLAYSPMLSEIGAVLSDTVWTNTNRDGTWSGRQCGDPSIPEAYRALAGIAYSPFHEEAWTNFGAFPCNTYARLYCFQVSAVSQKRLGGS